MEHSLKRKIIKNFPENEITRGEELKMLVRFGVLSAKLWGIKSRGGRVRGSTRGPEEIPEKT